MILDRNKIYTIGKNPKTVIIKLMKKSSDKIIDVFEVYKCTRRRNILYCKCLDKKLKLTFKDVLYAIECSVKIKKELKCL
jgi:hypothetical protein